MDMKTGKKMDLAQPERQAGETADLEAHGFAAVQDYWQNVRQGAAIPLSTDFDLLALTNWLPDLTLLDVFDLNNVVWRFVGTNIVDRMGVDPSGQNVFQNQSQNMLNRTARAYQAMADKPCGAVAHYTNHYSSGREGNMRSLFLPMKTPSAECTRLVVMTAQEETGTYVEPIERTLTATQILSIDWIDLGFGIPDEGS